MSIASRINEMTEHLRNDWNSINKLGLKAKKLPDEYRQVEYIESSGTQYIDTGFAPNQNTRTVIDFMPTYAGSLFIFGARLGYNNNAYDLYTFGSKFRDDYANTNYGGASSQPFPKSENKRYLFDKNKNHSIMYEENVQFYDHTFNEQAINLSFNMFLFGVDDNGSISSNMARMKLYSCKIYDDNTPIRDFVPCYRINDVQVGLYDTINDVFYTNQGAGAFTYGKIQEEIPNKNIKNIAPVLDRFYNKSSDKTDLSENGIVGRTSQEDTTGKNLLKVFSGGEITVNDITIKSNNNGTFILDGTPSATTYIEIIYAFQNGTNQQSVPKIELDSSKQYTVSINTKTSGIQFSIQKNNESNNINVNSANNSETFTSSNGIYRGYLRIGGNITFNNEIIKLQLEEGSTATEYEPYTGGEPSPSPDYPQPINNLSGDVTYKVRGKNKLNINASNYSKNGITSSTSNQAITFNGTTSAGWTSSNFNDCFLKANENYIFSISNSNAPGEVKFRIWGYEDESSSLSVNASANTTFTPSKNITKIKIVCEQMTTNKNYNIEAKCQIEKGSTPTEYEPHISESFPLSLKSKNLFDKDNANVLVGYINAGAKIISEQNDRIIYIPCKPNTTYVLQKMVQEPLRMNRFRVATSEAEPTYGMIVNQYYNPGDGKNIEKYIITTNDRANYLIFYCYYVLNNETTFEDMLSSIQIEEGSTATTYEPYYDINLCNISNYKDRIYSQNGEFYLGKKTVKVVLDGTETWNFGNAGATNINGASTIITDMMTSSYGDGYSNYFVNKKSGKDAYTIRFGANNNTLYFYVNNNEFSNVDVWKTWLSTHNTEVEYVLATPTYTKITEENYPTLYSQLLAIQEFLTKYKINKEFLLNYSSPEIEY